MSIRGSKYAPGGSLIFRSWKKQQDRKARRLRNPIYHPIAALFASGEEGAWYDPSDLSTMFQNSDGTTAAAVDSPVGYIADKSGNANHATQATAAARPALRQTAGGLYYLEFDGVDDYLISSLRVQGECSLMSASRMDDDGGISVSAQAQPEVRLYIQSFGTDDQVRFGCENLYLSGVSMSAAASVTNLSQSSALGFRGRVNGATTNTGAFSSLAGNDRKVSIGAGNTGSGDPSFFATGELYGVIARLRDAGRDADFEEQTENWLAAKAGVTL